MAAGYFPTQYMRESCKNSFAYVPDICQFWYTIALFRPVKSTPKIYPKFEEKNRPKFRVLPAKKDTDFKKKRTPSLVVPNISYARTLG